MNYDVIIIGGGPAGMFAAITAAEQGSHVLLLEANDRLGKKLLITGKGRCNVTNDCSAQEVLQNTPRNGRFLYSAMTAYPPEKIKAFFEDRGCALKTERGNRVFPVSDSARSILDDVNVQVILEKLGGGGNAAAAGGQVPDKSLEEVVAELESAIDQYLEQ